MKTSEFQESLKFWEKEGFELLLQEEHHACSYQYFDHSSYYWFTCDYTAALFWDKKNVRTATGELSWFWGMNDMVWWPVQELALCSLFRVWALHLCNLLLDKDNSCIHFTQLAWLVSLLKVWNFIVVTWWYINNVAIRFLSLSLSHQASFHKRGQLQFFFNLAKNEDNFYIKDFKYLWHRLSTPLLLTYSLYFTCFSPLPLSLEWHWLNCL